MCSHYYRNSKQTRVLNVLLQVHKTCLQQWNVLLCVSRVKGLASCDLWTTSIATNTAQRGSKSEGEWIVSQQEPSFNSVNYLRLHKLRNNNVVQMFPPFANSSAIHVHSYMCQWIQRRPQDIFKGIFYLGPSQE